MLTKFYKIFCLILLLIFQSPLYSKSKDFREFNSKNLSSYFSALVSYENQQNKESLKFFNSSKSLIYSHEPYLKKYINSLVQDGKIKKAAHQLKFASNRNNLNFFEAYLILFLDAIKKESNSNSQKYLKKLKNYKKDGSFEEVIIQSLEDFFYVFVNKKKNSKKNEVGDLGFINLVFQS